MSNENGGVESLVECLNELLEKIERHAWKELNKADWIHILSSVRLTRDRFLPPERTEISKISVTKEVYVVGVIVAIGERREVAVYTKIEDAKKHVEMGNKIAQARGDKFYYIAVPFDLLTAEEMPKIFKPFGKIEVENQKK